MQLNIKFGRRIRDWIHTIILLVVVILLKSFLFEQCFVPTGSMLPTIVPGDIILATKYDYGYSTNCFWPIGWAKKGAKVIFAKEPERGDIVIVKCECEGLWGSIFKQSLIKRLVGLPGDRMQFVDGKLFINGLMADREICEGATNTYIETLPQGKKFKVISRSDVEPYNSDPFYLPQGKYFLLGDNRDNSSDSRYELGYVSREQIVAKAKFVLLRTNKTINPLSWSIRESMKTLDGKVH